MSFSLLDGAAIMADGTRNNSIHGSKFVILGVWYRLMVTADGKIPSPMMVLNWVFFDDSA